MSLHVHALRGCAPTPLAHYLKALGVLRLVATQRDEAARGFWKDDVFHLATTLDRDALLRFFCDEYAPTPMLSPWNGGSGFYPKDSKEGINAIATSPAARFASYRSAIERARAQVSSRTESPKKEAKDALLAECAREWQDAEGAWLAAAISLEQDGTPRYPALLGTGGNDGRLDFTNNAMQRLTELVDAATGEARPHARPLAELALFGGPVRGLESGRAIGQFLPGAAGGANGTAGFDAGSLINPWDFVLMLEGALVFRVAALRRLQGADLAQAAAPFALRGVTEGYASASDADASARGEQWVPLWGRPATFAETARMFAEARLCGGRRSTQSALDAARAVARFGVERGVTGFARFAFLERNGQANLAVPLGTFAVEHRPDARLLDELDGWLDRLRRAAREKSPPTSVVRSLRRIESLAMAACGPSASRETWASLVIELGEAEDAFARRAHATAKSHLQPLPLLSAGWLAALDDGSAEVRVALAIASQRAPVRHGAADALGPIRAHCLPLDDSFRRFATAGSADRPHLVGDPRVLWRGQDLASDLAAIALRRAVEAHGAGHEALPLIGQAFAELADVRAFVEGRLDDARIASLARGLMALDFRRELRAGDGTRGPREPADPLHALFRVAYLPEPVGELRPRCDPTILRTLVAGRLTDAVRLATRRLVAMGIRPKLQLAGGDARLALRLAATCAIPIARGNLRTLIAAIGKPFHAVSTPEAS